MVKDIITASEGISLSDANQKMIQYGRDILPIVDRKRNLRFVVFKKDMVKHLDFPNELVDDRKRYMVAAAVSTQERDRKRIDALLKARSTSL